MLRSTVFLLVLVAITFVNCEESCPGRDVSFTKQCADKGHNAVCKYTDPAQLCANLICTQTGRGDIPGLETYNIGPALQGSWCGVNKICIEGRCRDDPSPPATPAVAPVEETLDCNP